MIIRNEDVASGFEGAGQGMLSRSSLSAVPAEEGRSIFADLIKQGGPRHEEFELFWRICDGFSDAIRAGDLDREQHQSLIDSMGLAACPPALLGHIYRKPYGYAGDFKTIDMLYTKHVSPDPLVTRWDQFVQAVPPSHAVRNRGPYLERVMKEMLVGRATQRPFHLVSLGSGPGRDLEFALNGVRDLYSAGNVQVTCIDMDSRALAHSERVLSRFSGTTRHLKANVLRLRLDQPADLIWSSGLFDYFSDRSFVAVLKRLLKSLNAEGRVVIGNFSEQVDRYGFMDFFDWRLNYRSKRQLDALAAESGASKVSVAAEAVGINLFLHAEAS